MEEKDGKERSRTRYIEWNSFSVAIRFSMYPMDGESAIIPNKIESSDSTGVSANRCDEDKS